MGTTNLGNQYITFRYRHPAKAQDFNTLLRGGIQAGIYEGANVTIASANTISISPFIAYINVGNDKTIRIQTFLPITLTVNESTPVIYLMYEWQNVINNYVDILQRDHGSQPIENEVCVCECIFTNGSITGIDYSVRNYGKQIQIPIDENLPPIITNSQIKVNNLNADLLDGKHAGNNAGDISINNGTLNNNLNADLLDSYHIDEFMLQHEGSYSKYYVQNTAPTTNHGTLWYNTTNNKLYKYNNILSKWIEINWQEIVKATPEWQAGKLRVSSGQLQITPNSGTNWYNCYPACGSKTIGLTSDSYKIFPINGVTCIITTAFLPIVFAQEVLTSFRFDGIYSRASSNASVGLWVSNSSHTVFGSYVGANRVTSNSFYVGYQEIPTTTYAKYVGGFGSLIIFNDGANKFIECSTFAWGPSTDGNIYSYTWVGRSSNDLGTTEYYIGTLGTISSMSTPPESIYIKITKD